MPAGTYSVVSLIYIKTQQREKDGGGGIIFFFFGRVKRKCDLIIPLFPALLCSSFYNCSALIKLVGGSGFCVEEPETAPAGYTLTINKSLNLMILFMPPARPLILKEYNSSSNLWSFKKTLYNNRRSIEREKSPPR